MQIEQVKIETLVSPDWNPRQGSEKEAKDLKASIQKFGFVDPIIVNKRNNSVVGGNFRVKVAKELGFTEIPAVFVDLDEAQEKELNIRLNKNTGEWDWDKLANEFDVDFLKDIGFTDFDLKLGKEESESLGYSIDCPHCQGKIKVSNRVKTVEKL